MTAQESNDFLLKILGEALALVNENVIENVKDKDLQSTLISKNNDALSIVAETNYIKD